MWSFAHGYYNAEKSDEKYSILVEFKNVNRRKMLEYIASDGEDSIYEKIKDSVVMIKNDIEFEDGYSGDELIKRIHILLVYGDKADTVSAVSFGFEKNAVTKNHNGRQSRAVSLNRKSKKEYSNKQEEEILTEFGGKLQKLNLVACKKGYFGIPIPDPKGIKYKGIGTLFYYTMLAKSDFVKMVDEVEYFAEWNWGKYKEYFTEIVT